MNRRSACAAALGALLGCGALPALPAEIAIRVPDTAAARSAAAVISSAGRALHRYLDACEFAEARDPHDIVTNDVRIEYTLGSPGAYLSFDASALFAGCAAALASIAQQKVLWIYPTAEKNSLFVQYDTPDTPTAPTPSQPVALIEMRGDRIQRLRNFGAPPPALLAAMSGAAQSELCARLSQLNGLLASSPP